MSSILRLKKIEPTRGITSIGIGTSDYGKVTALYNCSTKNPYEGPSFGSVRHTKIIIDFH